MFSYVIKRLVIMLPTALGVATLAFFLLHLAPGDVVEVILGENAIAADREALKQALGLNLPLHIQYIEFIKGLLTLNWGESFYQKDVQVLSLIFSRFPSTLVLATGAIIFALPLALFLGVVAAKNPNKTPDKLSTNISLLFFSMPSFWLGPLLMIVFSLWLNLLPVSGNEGFSSVILPSITLGLGMCAMMARFLRNSLVEVMHEDYIRTAYAKGGGKNLVFYKHALRNALLPLITVLFLQAGALLTGAILTEAVFSWPGIGQLLVESINNRDYPVVQGCTLFIAFIYMIMTLLADILYAVANPQLKSTGNNR